jgi:Sulfotransferase family
MPVRPETTEPQRPTVVYIGAHDRSGSTLLDRVLGELPGCVSLGEVRRIWDRGLGQNQLCGCGTPFRECAYWQTILRHAFGDLSPQRIEGLRRLAGEVGRMRHFPSLLARTGRRRETGASREYVQVLGALYRAILEVSGDSVLIDSSKDPVYGAILLAVPDIDVRMVHLVRDARAVAFSQQRTKPKPEIHWRTALRKTKPVAETAIRWDLSAVLWRALARRSRATFIRYEDLARSPVDALAPLAASLDPDILEGLDRLRVGVHLGIAHTVSGASMRFHRGDLDIVLDAEWRRAMTWKDRAAVTALTWPGLLRFGYPLRLPIEEGTHA